MTNRSMIKNYFQVPLPIDFDPKKEDEQKKLIPYKKMGDRISWIKKIFRCLKYFFTHLIHARRKKRKKEFLTSDDDESLDWWTKYFASLEVSVMIKYPLEISRNCENCGRDDSFQEERRRELNGIPPPEQKVTATFKVSYSRLANFHQLRCLIGRETGIRRRTGDAAAILRLPGSSENVRAVEGAEKRGSRLRQRELRWKIQGLPNLSFFPPSSTVLCSSSLNILLGEIRWRSFASLNVRSRKNV